MSVCFGRGLTLLGVSSAVLPVIAAQHSPCALAGVLLVWPFVFDTTFTLLCRLRRRENIFAAHRSHLYQRLVRRGHSHGQVSLLYTALALFSGLLGLVFLWR